MKESKRYLVTGGAGFVGSNLVDELLRRGHRVRVLDNLTSGSLENLSESLSSIEFIKGDIRDTWTVREAVEGCDYILHQAALVSVPHSIQNPQTTNAINVTGTLNLLEAAREFRIKRFVFASSSAVYGDSDTLPITEKTIPAPLSPYAVSKLSAEWCTSVYSKVYGLPTVSLRYFNIFGPRQSPESDYAAVVPRFIQVISNGSNPIVYGDGKQTRDFIYISNAVSANLLSVESDQAIGGVYNVGCGNKFTLNTLIEKLEKINGVQIYPNHQAERPGDIMHSFADISRARLDLNYRPLVNFEDGLRMTTEWFKRKEKTIESGPITQLLKGSRIKIPESLTFHDDDTITSALLGTGKSRRSKGG
ncbi:MAG: SDR family oxidoreductase [candidate division Zixibacteria bacterium]|nr:SDR family oxidoreductase [candidate division Zixibacteria bacterium]